MLQMFSVNNFEWIKITSQFNDDFIKNYSEERDKGYFLENYILKNYMNFKMIYHFYLKE